MANASIILPEQETEFLELWEFYRENWVSFVEDVLQVRLEPKQAEMITAIQNNDRVAARTGHNVGKTFVAACVVLTAMSLYPYAQVVTTAPTNRQVEHLLWAEIGRRFNSSLLPELGFPQPLNKMWRIAPGWMAIGASSDEGVRLEGYHSPTIIVYLVDEAKGVKQEIMDSMRGGQNAPITRLFLFSTPGPPVGEFYEATEGKKKHLYKQVYVSGYDVPRPEHQKWMADMLEEYGIDNPVFIMRCLGKFADESGCMIFTQSVLKQFELNALNLQPEGKRVIGVDVARTGGDSTVFSFRVGNVLLRQEVFNDRRIDQTAAELEKQMRSFNADAVVIDSIGLGIGVGDILIGRGLGHRVERFSTLQTAVDDDSMANRKAQVAFKLAKDIKDGKVGGTLSPALKRDLESYTYTIVARGQFEQFKVVDPLDSPDHGDSLLLAFALDGSSGAYVSKQDEPAIQVKPETVTGIHRMVSSRVPMLEAAIKGHIPERLSTRYLIRGRNVNV